MRSRSLAVNPVNGSADRLQVVWAPFVRKAGTHDISGQVVTFHPLASKNPAAMPPGAWVQASLTVDGNTFTLRHERGHSAPVAHPHSVKLVRIE